MKKLTLLLLTLVCVNSAFSQIRLQKTYQAAVNEAARQGKPLFVWITVPLNNVPGTQNTYKGFEDKEVIEQYNTNFISYRLSVTDTSFHTIRERFQPTNYPAYLFLDSQAQLIYKTFGNGATAEQCFGFAQTALNNLKSGKTIGNYKLMADNNTINHQQLKEYILLRQQNGLYDNTDLIEKYISDVSIGQLNNYDEILFIMQGSPSIDSKAYQACQLYRPLIDSIYKTEPLQLRYAINQRIIANSLAQAIKTKNQSLAYQTATYVHNTYQGDPVAGGKAHNKTLLDYYKGVKDTASYMNTAGWYYDSNYMSITADKAKEELAKLQQPVVDSSSIKRKVNKDGTSTETKMVSMRASDFQAMQAIHEIPSMLNNAAWEFYTTGTKNPTHLYKALSWSKRAIEIQPVSAYYDTMSHLLYRLGYYDEAVLNQNKAIQLVNSKAHDSKKQIAELKTELNKMKQRSL